MAELLKDNIEASGAVWPMARKGPSAATPPGWTSRREVPDLLSWLQCFEKYACMFSEKFPEKNREL